MSVRRLAFVLLAFVALVTAGRAEAQAGSSAPTVKQLLDAAGLQYRETDGSFVIAIPVSEDGATQVPVLVDETSLGQMGMVKIRALVAQGPEGFRATPALLNRLNELNNRLPTGKVTLVENLVLLGRDNILQGMDADRMKLDIFIAAILANSVKGNVSSFLASQ